MKKFAVLFFLIAFCLFAGKGLHWAKEGFSLRRIQWPMSVQLDPWDPAIDSFIAQPFSYIGRGRQCFAFESRDGKYVLKLPRTDIYQIPFWLKVLPLSSLRKKLHTKQSAREQLVFNSFHIGSEELKDLTGILFLHLGKTEGKGQSLTLIDKLGYKYQISAHKTSFILQMKQPLFIKTFLEALKKKDEAAEKCILNALIDVIIARGNKGIGNRDGSFLRNYGFDGQKGFLIDVGTFYWQEDKMASIYDTIHPIRTWLSKTAPEMLSYFNDTLEEKLK